MISTPRVTLLLITYKQSKYVRSAVRSALTQDYPNLEIVISDDCSPDDTWQLIQKEIIETPTPHKTIITKTAGNQGLAGNINHGLSFCSGDWIVMAAGDDISVQNRVTKIITGAQSAPGILGVASAYHEIDEHGKRLAPTEKKRKYTKGGDEVTLDESLAAILRIKPYPRLAYNGTLLGATAAWHRSLFERFGPLPPNLISEDAVLTLRARVAGRVRIVADKLIEYRKHSNSLTNTPRGIHPTSLSRAREQEKKDTLLWHRESILFRCMHKDLGTLPPGSARDRFLVALERQADAFSTLSTWWERPWLNRIRHYHKCVSALSLSRMKPKLLLPRPLYLGIQALTLKKK